MKTIYLVRHGDYLGEELIFWGLVQMQRAASEIKDDIGDLENVVIYTSRLGIAQHSAQILSRVMEGVPVEECFQLDSYRREIHKLVNEINGTAIIVSHKPDIWSYLERVTGMGSDLKYGQVRKVEVE
ncbi:MAG: phosphoglycerate mutase family protein [Nanoarchaeota archaeon]|nr:phosphoglycerate mutase family protein [Nanoarchaeota archaeon]